MIAALLSLILAASPAGAQQSDGVGIADNQGNFYSVTNRRGRSNYFHVTKLTLGGAVLWNVPYDPGLDVMASAITVDREGSLIVAGTIAGPKNREVMIAKFTPFGSFVFRQSRDAGGDAMPTAVATDNDGNIVVAATVSEANGSHLHVIRYGPLGAYFWGHDYRGGRTNYARLISMDPSGDARITVDTATGDFTQRSFVQTRQVLFTSYGAVVPQ